MKIQIMELEESVLCHLPNGEQVEVTMVQTEGEDAEPIAEISEAMRALQAHLEHRGCL